MSDAAARDGASGGSGGGGSGGKADGGGGTGGTGGTVDAAPMDTFKLDGPFEVAPVAALDIEMFKCYVDPIMDATCAMSNCHGATGPLAKSGGLFGLARDRNDELVDRAPACPGAGQVNLKEVGSGTGKCEGALPHTEAEWAANFKWAKTHGLLASGFLSIHAKVYYRDDADLAMVRRWLGGEQLGHACDTTLQEEP